jgi:hypothetical protein
MQEASRRIRQLRIKSQDENSISADINALQDAFNIASMPGLPPNGLLLVKKLDLGVYRTRSTSMSISKLIDEKIRSESYQPVCVDQQQSENKDVVWFSDTTEAVFALLKLVLYGQLPTAWYWSVIFPSLQKNPDLSEVLFTVSRDLPRSEIKPLVLVNATRMLVLQTDIKTTFDVITLPLVQVMASEVGLYPRLVLAAGAELENRHVYLPVLSGLWEEVIKKAVQVWGEEDLRSHWLAYCALVTANPALIENKLIWTSIVALIEAINVSSFKKKTEQGEGGVDGLDRQDFDEPFINTKKNSIGNAVEQVNLPDKIIDDQDSVDTEFKFEGLVDCEYSGFGFLVSLLGFLSIDELLSENPLLTEINFPVRILRLVSKRFGIDPQHPLLQALPETPARADQLVEKFIAPAGWQTLVRSTENIDSLLLRPTVRRLEITVQLLLSRFLYRYAKISLRSLIMHEGQIAITRTHLDILFDIDQLDIRIRKAGLDINPGWVSWLGLVVQFHYQKKEQSDA